MIFVQETYALSRGMMRGLLVSVAILGVPLCLAAGVFFAAVADREALFEAARTGDVARVERILDRHPNRLEQRDRLRLTPLHEAAWQGQSEVLGVLIRRGADVNAKWDLVAYGDGNWNALHIAANVGRVGAARVLVRAGTNINEKSLAGETPLDIAIRNHHSEVAELLIAHGGVRGESR